MRKILLPCLLAIIAMTTPLGIGDTANSSVCAAEALARFVDAGSGLSIVYPRNWSVERNPEEDCIVKMTGIAGGYNGEIKLNVAKEPVPPDALFQVFEAAFARSVPTYKRISGVSSRFGTLGSLNGSTYLISFKVGDLPIRQQFNIFQQNGKTYTIAFTAPEAGYSAVLPVFQEALRSATFNKTAASAHRSVAPVQATARAQGQWQLVPLSAPHGTVKFAYPEGWKVAHEGSGDSSALKITGGKGTEHEAEFHLWMCPRGEYSTEQLAELVEQEHLKPLQHYHRLTRSNRTFGAPPIEGIAQHSSFVADGMPGKQTAFFFTDKDKFYCLALMAVSWSDNEMRNLFDRVASSLKTNP